MQRLCANASDLMTAVQGVPLPGCPPWLDTDFLARPGLDRRGFVGCGLYCAAFGGRTVYVGKFLGSTQGPFSGNVLDIRWLRHLPSLSMRGRRVSLSRGPLAALADDLPDGELRDGLRAGDAQALTHDRGYLASYNRVRFAANHWATLRGDPAALLGLFDLGYVRLEPGDTAGLDHAAIVAAVSAAEVDARDALQLCCNGEADFDSAWARAPRTVADVLDTLQASLAVRLQGQGQGQGRAVAAPVRLQRAPRAVLESDAVMERVEDDLPDGWPAELLLQLRTQPPTPDLEVHATATQPRGDLRVRVLDTVPRRNIVTLAWQPRLRRFDVRILLRPDQVEGQSGVQAVRTVVDPLPTAFHFDASANPGPAIQALLALIAEAARGHRGRAGDRTAGRPRRPREPRA